MNGDDGWGAGMVAGLSTGMMLGGSGGRMGGWPESEPLNLGNRLFGYTIVMDAWLSGLNMERRGCKIMVSPQVYNKLVSERLISGIPA